jgi:hypothetical protein
MAGDLRAFGASRVFKEIIFNMRIKQDYWEILHKSRHEPTRPRTEENGFFFVCRKACAPYAVFSPVRPPQDIVTQDRPTCIWCTAGHIYQGYED